MPPAGTILPPQLASSFQVSGLLKDSWAIPNLSAACAGWFHALGEVKGRSYQAWGLLPCYVMAWGGCWLLQIPPGGCPHECQIKVWQYMFPGVYSLNRSLALLFTNASQLSIIPQKFYATNLKYENYFMANRVQKAVTYAFHFFIIFWLFAVSLLQFTDLLELFKCIRYFHLTVA